MFRKIGSTLFCLNISMVLFAQCPGTALLVNHGTACSNGAQLKLPDTNSIARIDWLRDAQTVKTVFALPVGVTETIAGGNGLGAADNQLNRPAAVTVDPKGNLYIVDADNHRIQQPNITRLPSLTVLAPAAQAGIYNTAASVFSTANTIGERGPVSGYVVNYDDDLSGTLHLACGAPVNSVAGKIVLIDRGTCSFQTKVKNAELAGAIAVIVVNNVAGAAVFSMGGSDNTITIPAFLISLEDGAVFRSAISAGLFVKMDVGAISITGTAQTVAGGNGAGSALNQLMYPEGVSVQRDGNLLIADNSNQRILRWTPLAPEGTTVAGGNGIGSAANQLSYPAAAVADTLGAVYVADNSNHRIQKWLPGASTGITIAGGNERGSDPNQLNYPHAVFLKNNNELFISDDNPRISKWTSGASVGVTVAGGEIGGISNGSFWASHAVFVDAGDAIYYTDRYNQRVEKKMGNQTITVAGGNGDGSASNQLSQPGGICVDKQGNLLISDNNNHRVQLVHQTINGAFQPTEPGRYKAIVTNFSGCVTSSNEIVVYPSVAPVLSVNYNSYEVNCMDAVPLFTVTSNQSLSEPAYQWYRNNIAVTGETSASFNGRNLADNDSVKCRINTNTGGCLATNSFTSSNMAFSRVKQYNFTGNGNWTLAANWMNGRIPPSPLPCCTKLLIDPVMGGECVMNVPVTIPACTEISVAPGKRLRVMGNLIQQYDSAVVLQDNVRVAELNNTLISTAQEMAQGIYRYTYTGTTAPFAAGQVLVGSSAKGYIRKVTSVASTGNTITCQTTSGSMEDVFKQGRFKMTATTDTDLGEAAAAGYTYNFSDVLLYQNGPLTLKLNSGSVTLDPNWTFDFDFRNGKMKRFEAGFQQALMKSQFEVELTASQAVTLADRLDTLKRITKTITSYVPVFGIPVPVIIQMHIDFLGLFSANVDATIQRKFQISSTDRISLSMKYENNVWTPTYAASSTNNATANMATGQANVSAKLALIPRISFEFYALDGPYASLGVYEELKGSVVSPSLDWNYQIGAWLQAEAGCKTSVLGVNLIDFERIYTSDTFFYKTPHKIEKFSGDNQPGTPGIFLTNPIKVKITDIKGNPESNVPVYFESVVGGGSFSAPKVFTNSLGIAETRWQLGTQVAPGVTQTMRAYAKRADGSMILSAPVLFNSGACDSGAVSLSVTTDGLVATVQPIGGTAPYIYSWNNGESSGTTYSNLATRKNITVKVTDANGCTGTRRDICVGAIANLVQTPCTEQAFDFYFDGALARRLGTNGVANAIYAGYQTITMIGVNTGVTHQYPNNVAPGQSCAQMFVCCPDAGTCSPGYCQ